MKIETTVIKGKNYLLGEGWRVELTGVSSGVRMRQIIEVQIAAAFITEALKADYRIAVDNGENSEGEQMTSLPLILGEMFKTDEDTLVLYSEDEQSSWVKLIYGNDGWDVISDYTTDLEPLMGGEVKRLQDEFSI